jgi:hypothetical protein
MSQLPLDGSEAEDYFENHDAYAIVYSWLRNIDETAASQARMVRDVVMLEQIKDESYKNEVASALTRSLTADPPSSPSKNVGAFVFSSSASGSPRTRDGETGGSSVLAGSGSLYANMVKLSAKAKNDIKDKMQKLKFKKSQVWLDYMERREVRREVTAAFPYLLSINSSSNLTFLYILFMLWYP